MVFVDFLQTIPAEWENSKKIKEEKKKNKNERNVSILKTNCQTEQKITKN